ncbi:hypothetical protein V5O48_001521 [Marasmius crinis-equi]|uniref:Cytochrome b5 heme-binding domain-containing protein n=1 Tax=Marasmius crinis-equi TaxID=585013 RepID=A0ABR3FYJ8_9AGAR
MAEKVVTYEELKAANTKSKLYVVISGKGEVDDQSYSSVLSDVVQVYNVSDFIDEHPGGDEVILAEAGAHDATEAFEDVGHSDEARALLPGMLVGTFKDAEKLGKGSSSSSNMPGGAGRNAASAAIEQGSNAMYFVPLALLGGYFAWRFYAS